MAADNVNAVELMNAEFGSAERHFLLHELSLYTQRTAFGPSGRINMSALADAEEEEKSEEAEELQRKQLDWQKQLFSPELLANLWLCDAKRLTELLETVRCANDGFRGTVIAGFAHGANMSGSAGKWHLPWRFDERSAYAPTSAVSGLLAFLNRSVRPRHKKDDETAAEKCMRRDGYRCVLTGVKNDIKAVHIVPPTLQTELYNFVNKTEDYHSSFFSTLPLFWRDEMVNAWIDALRNGAETCENMITMQPFACEYYLRGHYGLYPVSLSKDKKKLTMKFIWLPHASEVKAPTLTRPPVIPEFPVKGTQGSAVKNCETASRLLPFYYTKYDAGKLVSGQTIVMHTDDPVARPLPSYELLRLQWMYQRIKLLTEAGKLKLEAEEAGATDEEFDEWVLVDKECYPSPKSPTSSKSSSSSKPSNSTSKSSTSSSKCSCSSKCAGEGSSKSLGPSKSSGSPKSSGNSSGSSNTGTATKTDKSA